MLAVVLLWLQKLFKKKSFFVLEKSKSIIYLHPLRAISSVGSEHLVYTQRVGGSNPSLPTTINLYRNVEVFFCKLHLQKFNFVFLLIIANAKKNNKKTLHIKCLRIVILPMKRVLLMLIVK